MSVSSARPGRREKKSAPPPTNGSTWRICSTPEGSSGRNWLSNRPLPPTHFTKGAASRGLLLDPRYATAADVVICSMITYTGEKTARKTARGAANSDLVSASWRPRLGSVCDHGPEPIHQPLPGPGMGGPNEKRMCSTNREGRAGSALAWVHVEEVTRHADHLPIESGTLKKSSLLRSAGGSPLRSPQA